MAITQRLSTRSLRGYVLNIAHRGASTQAPEHTFPAWDLALEQGADYIELDLQMTRDGVLVVMHDATLDRTCRAEAQQASGRVSDKAIAEVKRCDVGRWFNERYPSRARESYVGLKAPTLEEVFERYGRHTNYYIEVKDPSSNAGMEETLLSLMEKFDLIRPAVRARRVLIQSFFPASLKKLHALEPGLPLIQLFAGTSPDLVRQSLTGASAYSVGIGPAYGDVDERLIVEAHDLGLEVHPYTVDSRRVMTRLVELGVDGIFTNRPRVLESIRAPARSF